MRVDIPSNAPLTRLGRSIKNAAVVMVSSLDADGALLTRPMMPLEMDGDGGLWFFTDLHATTARHSRVANVSFADQEHGTFVSLPGRSEINTDRAHIERLWPSFSGPAFFDGPDAANLALLKFVPDPTIDWDAPRRGPVALFAKAPQATEHSARVLHDRPLAPRNMRMLSASGMPSWT